MGSVLESMCLQKSSPLGEFMLPLVWTSLQLFSVRETQSLRGVVLPLVFVKSLPWHLKLGVEGLEGVAALLDLEGAVVAWPRG